MSALTTVAPKCTIRPVSFPLSKHEMLVHCGITSLGNLVIDSVVTPIINMLLYAEKMFHPTCLSKCLSLQSFTLSLSVYFLACFLYDTLTFILLVGWTYDLNITLTQSQTNCHSRGVTKWVTIAVYQIWYSYFNAAPYFYQELIVTTVIQYLSFHHTC